MNPGPPWGGERSATCEINEVQRDWRRHGGYIFWGRGGGRFEISHQDVFPYSGLVRCVTPQLHRAVGLGNEAVLLNGGSSAGCSASGGAADGSGPNQTKSICEQALTKSLDSGW